jgi:hypothetical protein
MGTLVVRRTATFDTGSPVSWVSVVEDSQKLMLPQMKQLGLRMNGDARRAMTTEILAYYPTLEPDTVWTVWQDIEDQYDD